MRLRPHALRAEADAVSAHPLGERLLAKALLDAIPTQIATYCALPSTTSAKFPCHYLMVNRLISSIWIAVCSTAPMDHFHSLDGNMRATKVRTVSNWSEPRCVSLTPMTNKTWNDLRGTAHKRCPAPKDPDAQLLCEGTVWIGDRRAAHRATSFMPRNVDPKRPQIRRTDWTKVLGVCR